jgi:hypothetical protein
MQRNSSIERTVYTQSYFGGIQPEDAGRYRKVQMIQGSSHMPATNLLVAKEMEDFIWYETNKSTYIR